LSFSKLKQIEKATFKILLIVLFKIAIMYMSIIKLLLKRIISIANYNNARLLNKIFRSLLITITIASKVSFYISKIVCEIYWFIQNKILILTSKLIVIIVNKKHVIKYSWTINFTSQILLSDLKSIVSIILNALQILLIYFRSLISSMQKCVNIEVNISLNSFNKCKIKIMFLLKIYLKAILNLKYHKQATTIVQTLSKIFIAKSL